MIPRRRNGFTLMEMVIAIALGLILLYVVYTALNNAGKATVNTLAQVKLHNRARAVISRMMRDLESIHPAPRFSDTGVGIDIDGSSGTIIFHSCLPRPDVDYDRNGSADTVHDLVWIKYSVNGNALYRDWDYDEAKGLPEKAIDHGTSFAPKLMLENVSDVSFAIAGLNSSAVVVDPDETSGSYPKASGIVWPETITVSFTLTDAQSGLSRDFSFTAFIPGN